MTMIIDGTAGIEFPDGTDQATALPAPGTSGNVLTSNGTSWTSSVAAGAVNGIFYENNQNVTTSYTITSGKNAMSAGPITIDSGVTVTIPVGSEWTIV